MAYDIAPSQGEIIASELYYGATYAVPQLAMATWNDFVDLAEMGTALAGGPLTTRLYFMGVRPMSARFKFRNVDPDAVIGARIGSLLIAPEAVAGMAFTGVKAVRAASVVEKGAKIAQRERILANIAASKAARESSNFLAFAEKTRSQQGIVYLRIDKTGKLAPYGGQAKSEARYIARQHEHARNHPDADFDFEIQSFEYPGSALDIAEHRFIQSLTNGQRAKTSPLVSNRLDPVGPARRRFWGLPEPKK